MNYKIYECAAMAKKFLLSDLSDKHELVTEIKDILEKATLQRVAFMMVEKMKKTAGVAVKDVIFNMENGQSLTLTFRTDGDVIKTLLNKKNIPISKAMDYDDMPTFKSGVEELALKLKGNQSKFDIARTKQRVVIPYDPSKRTPSKAKQMEQLNAESTELDTLIAEKHAQLALKQKEYADLVGTSNG